MAELSHLISHRFRGFAPHENTIAGLLAALDFGVAQVEFDIRVTKCGTPLIYHDEAARDGHGKLRHICDIMASERQALGGVFAHMPTAKALFAAAAQHENRARLLIDMKDAGFEDMLVALAEANRLTDRILWVSWLPETLYAVRDLLPDAKLCLSHWCAKPGPLVRKVHTVFEAPDGQISRPARRSVHGERSGWYVAQPLKGEMRELVSAVCVPRKMVTRALVENYQADGIEVSAFSYVTRKSVEAAEAELRLDAFFIDDRKVFNSFT